MHLFSKRSISSSAGRLGLGLLLVLTLLTLAVSLVFSGCGKEQPKSSIRTPSFSEEDQHSAKAKHGGITDHEKQEVNKHVDSDADTSPGKQAQAASEHEALVKIEPDKKASVEPPINDESTSPARSKAAPKPNITAVALPEISRGSDTGLVAVTLDAGASAVPTPQILRTLRERGLHITFFLTGKWCKQHPELVKQMANDGHEIGNHTWSHPDLKKLSDQEIAREFERTNEIIVQLTGVDSKPFFRPPFGSRDARVLRVAAKEGYQSIYWSIDSWDSVRPNYTSNDIKKRVLDRLKGGDIILMHCGSQATADALPSLLDEIQSRGYRIVTVSELVNGSRI